MESNFVFDSRIASSVLPPSNISMASKLDNKCFLCNVKEIEGNCLVDSRESSLILCKVLNVPHLMNNLKELENVNYCQPCKKRILKIDESLNILKKLEKEVLEEKYSIMLKLQTNYNGVANELQYSPYDFGIKLVDEMRFKSIKSKLKKLVKNQLDRKFCSKAKTYRIMKNITITEKLKDRTPKEHISKLDVPKALTTPLIQNIISTEKQPFINHNLSILGDGHCMNSANNSTFIHAELPLTSYVYDFERIKLESPSVEIHNSTDVKDPFEGIVPESSSVSENSIAQKTFICGICETNFDDYSQLDEHCRTHIVSKFRPNESNLSLNNTNSKIHVKSLKCRYCVKVFPDPFGLNLHERDHTGEKLFKCSHCDKSFSLHSSVKTHERIHTGEKPFKCSYCDKTFGHGSNRKKHESIHTDKKPFKCSYCDKSFSLRSSVKIHERLHTGEKPFKCGYCEKTFSDLGNTRSHERIHTGEKPFKCRFCDKTFRHQHIVKSHEHTHKEENQK